MAAAKDAEGTVSCYADDAVLMAPNVPIVTGKDAIRGFWKNMVARPGLAVAWKATKAEVARSGDLAYLIGTYELSVNDSSGKPVANQGKYSQVWKKQTDGNWKVVADMFNSDPPLPTPSRKSN